MLGRWNTHGPGMVGIAHPTLWTIVVVLLAALPRQAPGQSITEIIHAGLVEPIGIAVDAAGNVYVTGQNSSNAFKITPGLGVTEIIDFTGDGAGNVLNSPSVIAVDAGGNVYVTGFLSDNAFKIDACAVFSAPPEAERLVTLPGQPISTKNRFLSFTTSNPPESPLGKGGLRGVRTQAVRVTFVNLPPPFNVWNGAKLWVGTPVEVSENARCVDPACGPVAPTFNAATVQCTGPVFIDWNAVGVVHLFHEGIVPGGLYQIQVIDEGCSLESEANFSAPLELTQAKWGDLVENCTVTPCLPPDGINNILDVLAGVDKFVNAPTAITKARAELVNTDYSIGGCVNLNTNIIEVLRTVDAFLMLPYPFTPSTPDPCASTCPNPLPTP